MDAGPEKNRRNDAMPSVPIPRRFTRVATVVEDGRGRLFYAYFQTRSVVPEEWQNFFENRGGDHD